MRLFTDQCVSKVALPWTSHANISGIFIYGAFDAYGRQAICPGNYRFYPFDADGPHVMEVTEQAGIYESLSNGKRRQKKSDKNFQEVLQ